MFVEIKSCMLLCISGNHRQKPKRSRAIFISKQDAGVAAAAGIEETVVNGRADVASEVLCKVLHYLVPEWRQGATQGGLHV